MLLLTFDTAFPSPKLSYHMWQALPLLFHSDTASNSRKQILRICFLRRIRYSAAGRFTLNLSSSPFCFPPEAAIHLSQLHHQHSFEILRSALSPLTSFCYLHYFIFNFPCLLSPLSQPSFRFLREIRNSSQQN